jgi:hypothetical protein
MTNSPNVMLLGRPNSGKTHFLGQFYGRIVHTKNCALKLSQSVGIPPDLTLLKEVFDALASGRTAPRTSTDTWGNLKISLESNAGHHLDFTLPDYGGEQLKNVFEKRIVKEEWVEFLGNSRGWLLLIRLDEETVPESRLIQAQSKEQLTTTTELIWDSNAWWIEVLQILLDSCQVSNRHRIEEPRLAILLTCYDRPEVVGNALTPLEALQSKLPLLSTFLHTNWSKDAISVWGLSSLGKNLNNSIADDDFADSGAETQGWIIKPDGGDRDVDLTLPLEWLSESK